uniref:Uncharacterized protein n=1 Tax=Amphimedon queenslandica TaxID=400682 RepID=A0A1X7T6K6_AMPQE
MTTPIPSPATSTSETSTAASSGASAPSSSTVTTTTASSPSLTLKDLQFLGPLGSNLLSFMNSALTLSTGGHLGTSRTPAPDSHQPFSPRWGAAFLGHAAGYATGQPRSFQDSAPSPPLTPPTRSWKGRGGHQIGRLRRLP